MVSYFQIFRKIFFCLIGINVFTSLFKIKFLIMEDVLISIGDQVIKALDGRTQRWLALQVAIPESDLSKKLKGKMDFTQEEIKSINTLLKARIKL